MDCALVNVVMNSKTLKLTNIYFHIPGHSQQAEW